MGSSALIIGLIVIAVAGEIFHRRRADTCKENVRLAVELAARDAEIVALKTRAVEQERLVYVDALTGIGNRRRYDEAIRAAVSHALRSGESLSLTILDMDDFKWVNDTYGHPVGDRVLAHVASLLKSVVRPADVVCRLGGDEFAIILVDTNKEGPQLVQRRLIKELREKPCKIDALGSDEFMLTVTVGSTMIIAAEPCLATRQPDALERMVALLYEDADRLLRANKQHKPGARTVD